MTNAAVLDLIAKAKDELRPLWRSYDHLKLINQRKVLKAFQDSRISDYHLVGTTGYGYGDLGRDAVEGVFAQVFRGEEALVRPNPVSGTHNAAWSFGLPSGVMNSIAWWQTIRHLVPSHRH